MKLWLYTIQLKPEPAFNNMRVESWRVSLETKSFCANKAPMLFQLTVWLLLNNSQVVQFFVHHAESVV